MSKRLSAGVLACALGATLAAAPAAAADPPVPAATTEYVVQVETGQVDAVARQVARLGGQVVRRMPTVDTLVAELPGSALARLQAGPAVDRVTPNGRVQLQSSTYDAVADANSMLNITEVVGARKAWSGSVTGSGVSYTGKGVDIALLDSGVTKVPGLDAAGKVVYGPDLSFESQSSATRDLDTYGHGTHMAGIIAGKDAGASTTTPATMSPDTFVGVAPDARLISLKLADAYGSTDVSQVIAGIDWVVQHRNDPGMNIRVLNLSYGTPAMQDYLLDPLSHAAEVAWRAGIVVVVAAGNDGTGTGKLLNPAQNPYVIAVGANATHGTTGIGDDTIPAFSSRGDGRRNPDFVVPGSSVQSLRVPGSYIDVQHGATGRIDGRFFRGSGTSQSAAVASGMAALLLQQRPDLTPDQVKQLLKSSARTLISADTQAQGAGLAYVYQALMSQTPAASQTWTRSTGKGTLDGARGTARLVLDGVTLSGEKDIFGKAFSSGTHAGLAESAKAWTGGSWNGSVWTGSSSSGAGWGSVAWSGKTWSGRTWAGRTWASGSWTGRTWASQSWSQDAQGDVAGTLTGRTWAGRTWAGGGWK